MLRLGLRNEFLQFGTTRSKGSEIERIQNHPRELYIYDYKTLKSHLDQRPDRDYPKKLQKCRLRLVQHERDQQINL